MDPFKKHFEDSINDPSNTNNFDFAQFGPALNQQPRCELWFDSRHHTAGQTPEFPMMNESMYLNQMPHFSNHNNPSEIAEEAARRREIRLLKNREAARECRRKKKEYVKCLENRVEVLETQNRALIEELKTLKDIHCNSSTSNGSDGRSSTPLKTELR